MPAKFIQEPAIRLVSITDIDFYDDREYMRLGNILLCDYRGMACVKDEGYTLVAFIYPRWFDDDTAATDGLTYIWVNNNDIREVWGEEEICL